MAYGAPVARRRQIRSKYSYPSQKSIQGCARLLLLLGIAGAALLTGCGGSSASSTGQGTSGTGGTGSSGGTGSGGTSTAQANSISVQFSSGGGAIPVAVATQVGSGAWTATTLQNGQFTISVPSGTQNYAYAYVCAPYVSQSNGTVTTNETNEYIYEQSVQDGTSVTVPSGCFVIPSTPPASEETAVTLNVDATAIPNTTFIGISSTLGAGSISGTSGTAPMNVLSGTSNFIVEAMDNSFDPLAVAILRSQTIPGQLNGGNPVVLSAANATTSTTVTYQNIPNGWGSPYLFANFFTSDGVGLIVTPLQFSSGDMYYAIPTSQVQSGDYYSFSLVINSAPTTPLNTYSAVGSIINTPATSAPTSFAFPAPLPASDAAPTAAALPTFNVAYPGFSDTSLTSTGVYGSIQWPTYVSNNPPQSIYSLVVNATSTYLNGATTLTVPNLATVPGFISAPSSGTGVSWYAGAYGESYPIVSPAPTTSKYSYALLVGTYTAP